MSAPAATSKKPLPPGTGSGSPSTTPSRNSGAAYSPRSSTPLGSASANSSTSSLTRSRSLRSGTPVSARAAAAHSRRESLLSGGASRTDGVNGGSSAATAASGSPESERELEARAEAVAALDDLRERLGRSEALAESYRRQLEMAQRQLDESLREQGRSEERVHECEEQIEALQNERRESARQMREMEAIYEAERAAMTREREEMQTREEEMQAVIQRLKDSLAQRNSNAVGEDGEGGNGRPSRQSTYLARSSSGVDDGNFAPPSSIHRSDSRNNSKLLLAKDKLIESLRLELAEAQIKLVESENQGGGRLREVERQLMEARMANARLMEDNESYQLLLQEKTLNGDFGKSDFSYMSSARREQRSSGGSQTGATNTSGPAANQDALNALEGRGASQTSLADELSAVGDDAEPGSPGQEGTAQSEESSRIRKLEAELRSMKDQNKALTLYINKIIERLLQHDNFEHILDQNDGGPRQRAAAPNTDKELPPPPPKQQPAATGPSLLQRAKSIAISATAAASKPRPRPASVVQPPPQPQPGGFADPETAPSIPIGLARTQSLLGGIGRRGPGGRPMSEQFTGAGGVGGAGVVHQMYRGGAADPTSPTARAQNFFAPGGSGARAPSQGHSPLAARPSSATDGEAGAGRGGNFPGSMHSETSSTSESDDVATGGAPSPPNQASPPRPSAASIHTAGSGSPEHPLGQGKSSTMFVGGNKPRPLRLVQENDTSAANAAAQNKRASWIGWAWNATVAGGHGQGQDTVKN